MATEVAEARLLVEEMGTEVPEARSLVEARGTEVAEEEDSEPEWKLQVDLPDDAYSSLMVTIVEAVYGTLFSTRDGCLLVPQAIVHYAVLVFAQVAIIVFLDKAVLGFDRCNVDISTDVLLQYIGVGAFVGEMLQEVSASGTMLMVVWVSTDARFGGRCRRALLTLVFILPKAAVAVWLIIVGSQFVLTSASNVDLIMNCVALTFVNNMDDVMYNNLYHLYADQHSKLGWSIEFESKTVEGWLPVRIALKTLAWAAFTAVAVWSEPDC
ncbi:unnamed protein product [Symbiodinium sp. CCMP2456]|nr:unnamed protein product [Symbiodinium sp. CCMP2456]